MEDFRVRYNVCSTKNEKIMLLSDSEGGIKRKENEKKRLSTDRIISRSLLMSYKLYSWKNLFLLQFIFFDFLMSYLMTKFYFQGIMCVHSLSLLFII